MRQVLRLFLVLALLCAPLAVQAQDDGDAAMYQIADVAADVTADSAARARDQAILQAQRNAFTQLLARLDVDAGLATKTNDDALAALVQAFEVQQERTSAVRYIGTFTVQFKPNAVRALFNKGGVEFSETRSRNLAILPVVSFSGRNTLWEDRTKWRVAWEDSVRITGMVPITVPGGDMDDINTISATEAVNGKTEALQALIRKYDAGGAVVAVLSAGTDAQKPELYVDVQRYDTSGKNGDPVRLTFPAAPDDKTAAITLAEAVKQVRAGLEASWKQSNKPPKGPTARLPVTVPITTLAVWTGIKTKLAHVPNIRRTNVVTLARGAASVELEYRGDIPQLQTALAQQDLALESGYDGAWTLRATTALPSP